MAERIYKLQPERTMELRGFDHLGAAAAMHGVGPQGFTVSGVFRDAADFAVLVLYNADNFYEHPRLKYLPDFDFSGICLEFDADYSGLMPLDCGKYPTIDWPYLGVLRPDGVREKIRLSDYATPMGQPNTPAEGVFHIQGENLQGYDRLTLWYQNLAFDYIVPGKVWTVWGYTAGNPGRAHSVMVENRAYVYIEQAGDTAAAIAAALAERMNGTVEGYTADPSVAASASGAELTLRAKGDSGGTVEVAGSGFPVETLHMIGATTVCRALAAMINGTDYTAAQTPFALAAAAEGTALRVWTREGGFDADFIRLYAVWKNEGLRTSEEWVQLQGGQSVATLRVRLDFSALGLSSIRQMWMTFAPRLRNGEEYTGGRWSAVFSNWTVTGPEETRRLKVASTGSVRVNSAEPVCRYEGAWQDITGFYYANVARKAWTEDAKVTVRYYCGQAHELWLGTELGERAGTVRVEVDGMALPNARLSHGELAPPVATRVRLSGMLAAGEHVVTLTMAEGPEFVFDFLEAAVPGDVPEAAVIRGNVSPALDYSTDHAYKLPPARILWMFDKLGYRGPVNEYIGVFWWNARKRVGGYAPQLEMTFSGEFEAGDQILMNIGGQACGKTVFPHETNAVLARHFAFLINATYVGVYAVAEENRLKVVSRSAAKAYEMAVTMTVERAGASQGAVTGDGWLLGGWMGTWEVDTEAAQPLNEGAWEWHRDFYSQCAARGLEVTTACSMELVNPPEAFAARYADGQAVVTDVGFGGLRSTHCAFRSDVLAYQKKAYGELAGLMAAAGLRPGLQFGEFTWWYFASGAGMAYYDEETRAAAEAALGRPPRVFTGPNDDPGVNGGADAAFLRGRLRDHVAALAAHVRGLHPAARLEVLFPYDVNHPAPKGVHQLGGRLNRHVNLPAEWESAGGSGLDGFKLEALDFGAWSRDLDLMRECQRFAAGLGWPGEKLRMMTPVFRAGYPWQKEVASALELGFGAVNLWAFDHVCIYGLEWGQGGGRAGFGG